MQAEGVLTRRLVAAVRWYQETVSADVGARCRFTPSCSQYAIDALELYGPVKGTAAALLRLRRCNHRSAGGHDPAAAFAWRR